MSDYISKKKLISHIETEYKSFGEDYDALQILGDIEDFHTEERPHGEWIETYYSIDGVGASRFKCSECEHEISTYGKPYNFCPNCGKPMRKEGKTE